MENFLYGLCVLEIHSKITFSIARIVIMIGLFLEREDAVTAPSRLVSSYFTIEAKFGGIGVEKFISRRVMGCTKRSVCAWSARR